MANNLPVNTGTGPSKLKTEDVGSSVHVPSSRVGFGSAGNFKEVDTAAGYGLPMQSIDGSIATIGTTTDSAASSDTANVSMIALMKRLLTKLTTMSGQQNNGGQVYRPGAKPTPGNAGSIAITDTNATQIIAAAGAIYYLTINTLIVTNTSASPTTVTFTEGSAGAVKLVVYVPATTTLVIPLPAPIIMAANTAFYAKCSAGVTTLYVAAYGGATT